MPSNQDFKLKSKHKKSLSDNFNISHDQLDSNMNKYYEMFSNLKAPEDFVRFITPSSKSRFVKDFNSRENKINVDLNPMNLESNQIKTEYFSNSLAIKNYNISNSNISSLNNSFSIANQKNYEEKNINMNQQYNYTLEKISNSNKNIKSPLHYANSTPPGLTPKKNIINSNASPFKSENKNNSSIEERSKVIFLMLFNNI